MTSSGYESRNKAPDLKTIFPKVISASRATDIPAFYADWFMERLRDGYCQWQNPFNANQRQIISFAETEAIVFWSKNPAPLLPYLREISDLGKKFYFQYTLNDYGDALEPGVPGLAERIGTFKDLAKNCKVIWRYDPVIFGDRFTVKSHIRKLEFIMRELGSSSDKLVFSFVDLYVRAEQALRNFNSELRGPRNDEMESFSAEFAKLRDRIAPRLRLATCAESEIDFGKYGIERNSCIDPALLNELCGHEIYAKKKPRRIQGDLLLGSSAGKRRPELQFEKDKGQREACGCAPSKDIGSYRAQPCGHHCRYCYAGHARMTV